MNAIILSAIWGIVMMFSGIFFKKAGSVQRAAVTGMILLLAATVAELYGCRLFTVNTRGMLAFNNFSLVFNALMVACTLLFLLLSSRDILKVGNYPAEYFALLFFVLCGVNLASSFTSLLLLFLGIEIISIPLYILTGSDKKNLKSNEASLKYFLMGSFSTGIMIMGIALIYGARGSFQLEGMNMAMAEGMNPLLIGGLLLLLASMAFKVSAVPFHFWAPDVYDGAPTPFAAFMATIVKAAAFIAFLRLFDGAYGHLSGNWHLLFALIIAATLFVGNITAIFQQSVKRMLAYSSVAHAGFLFFTLFSYNDLAKEGMILYVTAYSIATIGLFAVLAKMQDYTFEGFNGLAKTQPVLAATSAIFLFSLAGIPLTAGFTAKFYVLAAALKTGTYGWLVIFAVICAAISTYYYFRVIQAMYFKSGKAETSTITPSFKAWLIVSAVLIILLGIFPQLLFYKLYF